MSTLFVCLMLAGGLLVLSGGSPRPWPVRRRQRTPVSPVAVVGGAIGAAAVALIVTAVPVAAALAGVGGAALPGLWRRRRERLALDARLQQWPELLDNLTSAVRAGVPLPAALGGLAAGADPQLARALRAFTADYRRRGDFLAALDALLQQVNDPILDRVGQTLAITRDVGGHDLPLVLRSLTTFVREDLRLRGELAARQSWTVNAARLAVAAPWLVLALLSSRPQTAAAYSSAEGALVLLGVAASGAVAYAVMLRLARLPGVAR